MSMAPSETALGSTGVFARTIIPEAVSAPHL